jgi:hypothetical protein
MPNMPCALTRQARPTSRSVAPSSSVAGVVLYSTRRSARASRARIAAACSVTENTIGAWEGGTSPLASVPMPQIEVLIAALHQAGACRRLTADLIPAAWCDLIIASVAEHEAITCLLADPITVKATFRELLAWCMEGHMPARYRPYATMALDVVNAAALKQIHQVLGGN